MARAAVAAGADGLLIEVTRSDHALSDGAQSLEPNAFTQLMAELRIIAPAIGDASRNTVFSRKLLVLSSGIQGLRPCRQH